MIKIVVAPDKFKGTLTAVEAAEAICEGIAKAKLKCRCTDISIIAKPMADGGEGSMEAIMADEGECCPVSSVDSLMRPIQSRFGILSGKGRNQAVVEAASSIGLYHLTKTERNPLLTSSFGLGTDIRAALGSGCNEVIVALGGTATSDCGAGMLAALGCRFYDIYGNPVERPAGGDLRAIHSIDTTHMYASTSGISFIVLRDVDNPLLGATGAAAVFSRQKGADAAMSAELETGAAHFAHLAAQTLGCDYAAFPGTGAAGGIGWALKTFFNAELLKGADLIGSAIGLEEEIRNASLVVTGEGRFDAQSLHGKAAGYVASLAEVYGVPVMVLCGTRDKAVTKKMLPNNIAGVYALTDRISPREAYGRPVTALSVMAADIFDYLFQ